MVLLNGRYLKPNPKKCRLTRQGIQALGFSLRIQMVAHLVERFRLIVHADLNHLGDEVADNQLAELDPPYQCPRSRHN